MGPRIRVKYKGEWVPLASLAAQSKTSYRALYDRYIEAGRPEEVGDWLLGTTAEWFAYKSGFSLDGVPMSARRIAAEMRVSRQTVHNLADRHGKALKPEHFRTAILMAREARKRGAVTVKACVKPPDRSPGWWERENLADAGKNGFVPTPRGEGVRILI
jgi:hypothetical protein